MDAGHFDKNVLQIGLGRLDFASLRAKNELDFHRKDETLEDKDEDTRVCGDNTAMTNLEIVIFSNLRKSQIELLFKPWWVYE